MEKPVSDQFSLSAGMGTGATAGAPSPPVSLHLPSSRSTDSASGAWQKPSGNWGFSIALPTQQALPRLRHVFIVPARLIVFVCHVSLMPLPG